MTKMHQRLFPAPIQTPQIGRLMNTGEIRLYLKQAALLSNPVEPQLSTPQLNAWIDGTLDDPNSPS